MSYTFEEKPKRVKARRFIGDSEALAGVAAWVQSEGYAWFDMYTPAPAKGVTMDPVNGAMLLINSKGVYDGTVMPGDWVVKLTNGDFRSMSNEEFEATYTEVTE